MQKHDARLILLIKRVEGRSMRTNHLWLKRITKLGLLLMMGVSMCADAGLFGHTMSWKEEVLLHDGSRLLQNVITTLAGVWPTTFFRMKHLRGSNKEF